MIRNVVTALLERDAKTGDRRVFWGRDYAWSGSKWQPVDKTAAEKPAEPKAKTAEPEKKPKTQAATVIEKYRLKLTGPGHEKLAKAVERGIDKSADLCKINPPVCHDNLGITRDKMPQFPDNKVRDSFLDKLKASGVRVTEGKVKVGQLKASQEEIQAEKTIGMAGAYLDGKFDGIKNAIVISKDGYIVDGHHRWAALLAVGANEEMNVIRVGMPIRPLLDLVNDHPGVEKRSLTDPSIGPEKKEWAERLGRVLMESERLATFWERLSHEDSRTLRKGDQVVVRTSRAVAMHPGQGWHIHTLAAFDGPPEVTAEYIKFDVIPYQWAAVPKGSTSASMLTPYKPKSPGSALKVKYQDEVLLVPLEDVQSRTSDRGRAKTQAVAEVVMQADTAHGVGISPSASPADPESGRYQSYADGPVIRRRPLGYKPPRAGTDTLVRAAQRRLR